MKKGLVFTLMLLLLSCLTLGLTACNSKNALTSPPKYIGYSFSEPAPPVSPTTFTSHLSALPMTGSTIEPMEIRPENDLNIVLIYENEKRDMIVDVIIDDSAKGTNQVYSATSQNNNISSIETIYSDIRGTWITEVTLVIKSNNQPVNNRTIEVKETTFLRDLIKEGIAEIDDAAETKATYTILSKIEVDGAALYGRIGDKISIEEPKAGGREFIGFYYYENSTKVNYSPDIDGKFEFLNKPIELQIEWKNLTYKIEYIVDGARYGEIAEFTYSGSNDILREVNVKNNVAGNRETGEYFDGWYLDSSLVGERVESEESISSLIKNSEIATIVTMYGQILHSRFDPERNFFTYKSAQEYGYSGYAIAFNYDAMFANKNSIPQSLTIPAVVIGKKIVVIEGLKNYWQPNTHAIFAGLCTDLTISDGIKLIVENALKGGWDSISVPNNIEIDDPDFGNWFGTSVTIIYRY